MQIKRNQGITGAFYLADQAVDLAGVQEQFARAQRIRLDVCRCFGQRRDVHAKNEQFAIADDDVRFLDIGTSRPDRLDFPAFECDSGLKALFDEVIVKGFFVGEDAHEMFLMVRLGEKPMLECNFT